MHVSCENVERRGEAVGQCDVRRSGSLSKKKRWVPQHIESKCFPLVLPVLTGALNHAASMKCDDSVKGRPRSGLN